MNRLRPSLRSVRSARSVRPVVAEDPFLPVPVAEFECSDPVPVVVPNAAGQILLLVRMHGVPLGTLSLMEPGHRGPAEIVALIADQFSDRLIAHLKLDGLGHDDPMANAQAAVDSVCVHRDVPSPDFVSVVVCTLGEEPRLGQAIGSILAQTHRDFELIVVDNDPGSSRVVAALADFADSRLRIVAEPRRGLSVARNAGVEAACGSVVAFTDDDAVADPGWLQALISPFRDHPDVACVTGLVLPGELVTQAQVWFEEFGAFDKGFTRVVWSAEDNIEGLHSLGTPGERGVLFPYSCGVFGSGNNMAFRAKFLRSHDLFDVALGAGTLARGGEDIDAFLTVILANGLIIYEPRAVIKHFARANVGALRRQMFGYGAGMCAVVVKHTFAGPRSAVQVGIRVPAGVRKLLDPGSEKNDSRTTTYPKYLIKAELAGYAAGPWLYLRSRRAARRRGLYETAPASAAAAVEPV